MTYRVLDLFCGAGGSAMGLHRAWPDAEIVGVDIVPQKHYPFTFVRGDALNPPFDLKEFDFIWASPPCQGYSSTRHIMKGEYPKLIEPVRSMLEIAGRPYVIENVVGAPLRNPLLLCGTMFGLKTYRHRLFESSSPLPFLLDYGHGAQSDKLYGPYSQRQRDMVSVVGHGCIERFKMAMRIDWMSRDELAQAIPPAYSFYIARQIRQP